MIDITELASKIRLLLMDVDGVLTDGKLYNVPGPVGTPAGTPDGAMAETKGFDSQDGIALQWLARLGIVDRADQRARVASHRGARAAVQVQIRLPGPYGEDPDPPGDSGGRRCGPRRSGLHRRRFHRCGGDAAGGAGGGHRQRAARGEDRWRILSPPRRAARAR